MWGLARALGGRVLLRIEDHERGRSREEYDRALLEDLAWLGLDVDDGPVRQGGDGQVYAEYLASLAAARHVYTCDCTRRNLGRGAYPGRCRVRGLAAGRGRGLRVELGPGAERFDDAVLGTQAQEPAAQCGDLLLRDRLGNWTYPFAVVVDDLRQGVDLVIRGADLLDSTGRPDAARLPASSADSQAVGRQAQQGDPGHRSSRSPGGRVERGAGPGGSRVPRRPVAEGATPQARGPCRAVHVASCGVTCS